MSETSRTSRAAKGESAGRNTLTRVWQAARAIGSRLLSRMPDLAVSVDPTTDPNGVRENGPKAIQQLREANNVAGTKISRAAHTIAVFEYYAGQATEGRITPADGMQFTASGKVLTGAQQITHFRMGEIVNPPHAASDQLCVAQGSLGRDPFGGPGRIVGVSLMRTTSFDQPTGKTTDRVVIHAQTHGARAGHGNVSGGHEITVDDDVATIRSERRDLKGNNWGYGEPAQLDSDTYLALMNQIDNAAVAADPALQSFAA